MKLIGAVSAFLAAALAASGASVIDDSACVWKWAPMGCQPGALCSYQFKLGDLSMSQSCRVRPIVNKLPQQVHLAYAGTPTGTGMTVSWATYAAIFDSAVWVGATANNLVKSTAEVSVASYYSEGDYSLYQIHATLSGLKPNTKYYYKVGSAGDTTMQSEVASFTTARAAGDATAFNVLVYADAGDGDYSVATVDFANTLTETIDFVYHIGDISYADDDYLVPSQSLGFFFEEVWNKWMNSLTPIMSRVPYMVAVGNHEAECHSPNCQLSSYKKDHLGNYTAYNARFRMPSKESGGTLNMWHSFEHGPVHFTTISSETDYPGAPTNQFTVTSNKNGNFGDQLAWLEADLKKAAANRASVPWIIVGMHRPIYSVSETDKAGNPINQPSILQAAFEELFIKYGVDVVVAGHEHAYERNFPIARSTPIRTGVSADNNTYVNPKAPVYITTGAAGNVENHASKPKTSVLWNAASDYSNWGVSMLSVTRVSLEFKFVASANQAVLDRFIITKN
ncbi:Calcineurin-like phosphoesterase [Globisporangium polare]